MAAHDASSRWRTFLEEAKDSEVMALLSRQSNYPFLAIPFHELQSFDPDFAEDILENPKSILSSGSRTLVEICRERGEDIDAMLRVGELPSDSRKPLREIGSADIDKLRSVDVIVTKISEIKPRIHRAVFKCESCGHDIEIDQENERELKEPLNCPQALGGCGSSRPATRFDLVLLSSRMVNNQWIEIQEQPENVPSGAQPRRGMVLIEGDQVNKHLPGERITANVIPVVRSEVRNRKKTPMFDVIFHLISSEHESTPFTEISIDEEDRDRIVEVSKRDNLMSLVQDSIAPSVFATGILGHVKRSLALQLFGGVSRRLNDKTRSRGDIHILLMGDPGVAKSHLLSFISELSPRGRFATGGGVSGAGLTAAAVRDAFGDGRFALEAGVLPLSDRGLAAIDEFDKISEDDRRMMHPAMEQQQVHVAKGGITATLHSRCAILAAANPKDGRFSKRGPNQSVMRSFQETGLPPPLASRFDIIWMIRDEIRVRDDERIAKHILDNRTSGRSEMLMEGTIELSDSDQDSEAIFATTKQGVEHLTQEFLRKYIAFAKRTVHPQLNEEAKTEILDYYTNERQSFGREDQFQSDQSDRESIIPITARALEALIRLTESHARMHLREVATADDAKVALAVFKHWREESGIEDESELHSGVTVRARSNNSSVRQMVRDVCSQHGGVAERSQIYNIALDKGIAEHEVDAVLSKMLTSGELWSPRIDQFSFVR
ncbi:MAG: minichromosome maintenance protein MCM [Candidatus Thermoplasmatota archaeon]|nr:minichromosome maintenance protein MCM [Candidatus Thermoplasmatota archaeon]MED5397823.1 minichromosome maintenance protein MCM [Candidatus Thermoplasmatota archaeon]|tara:strand:+ start:2973 stop:5132 length:2160 start_codon:yes stop_codon:yes gene_type:complete